MVAELIQINPSLATNTLSGNLNSLGLSNLSIKVSNDTINLTMELTYKGGNKKSFTFNEPFILKIKNSNIQQFTFTDSNSYLIDITENLITYDTYEEYELALALNSMEFVR